MSWFDVKKFEVNSHHSTTQQIIILSILCESIGSMYIQYMYSSLPGFVCWKNRFQIPNTIKWWKWKNHVNAPNKTRSEHSNTKRQYKQHTPAPHHQQQWKYNVPYHFMQFIPFGPLNKKKKTSVRCSWHYAVEPTIFFSLFYFSSSLLSPLRLPMICSILMPFVLDRMVRLFIYSVFLLTPMPKHHTKPNRMGWFCEN